MVDVVDAEEDAPRCPECGSEFLTNGVDEDDNITTFCRACGHEWVPEC
jgi:hypothetical protein